MEVQIPGLAHRLKLYNTSDSRTFLIFFINRGGREDEYARRQILGRNQLAFETAIKDCLQEGGYIHQVQNTVITQIARKLQALEGEFVPQIADKKDDVSSLAETPVQPQLDVSSIINETKEILDQYQRSLIKKQDELFNQQKSLSMGLEQVNKSLKMMEDKMISRFYQLEDKLSKLEKQ